MQSDEFQKHILEELREIKSLLHDEALLDRIIRRRESQRDEWTRSIKENATNHEEPA